jgi:membrane-associated phospholipid phosphatase
MHTIACGGMLGLVFLTINDGSMSSGIPMILAVLITGIVFTSRKIVSNHTWFDLITGFILGILCQLTALWF